MLLSDKKVLGLHLFEMGLPRPNPGHLRPRGEAGAIVAGMISQGALYGLNDPLRRCRPCLDSALGILGDSVTEMCTFRDESPNCPERIADKEEGRRQSRALA